MLNSMCLADTKGFDESKFAGEYEIARECVFYFGPDINAFSESVFKRALDILSAQSKIDELKKPNNPFIENEILLEELKGVDVRAAYKDNPEVASYISDLDAKLKLKKDLTIVIADASAQSRVDYRSLPEKFQTSIGFSTLKK